MTSNKSERISSRLVLNRFSAPSLVMTLGLVWLSLCLAGCSYRYQSSGRYEIEKDGPDPNSNRNPALVKNATPKWEPKSRYGNPVSYEQFGQRYYVLKSSEGYKQKGIASWYGKKFHGKRTSSGEPYDMYAMSGAHKTLPLPTYVKVTNLRNGRHVILRLNDRGPFHDNRLIDLSYTAAYQLGIIRNGTGLVEVEAINPGRWQAQRQGGANTTKGGVKTPPLPQTTQNGPIKAPQPIPDKPPVIQPSKPLPTTPAKIYVQVGAFASDLNAQKLWQQLRQHYPQQAFIDHRMVEGRRFSRVRIGPIISVEKADGMAQNLLNQGHQSTRIVVE